MGSFSIVYHSSQGVIFRYYIYYDTRRGGRGWQTFSKCKNTLKPLLGAFADSQEKSHFPKQHLLSRFGQKETHPTQDKRKFLFVSSVQCSMEFFQQLVNQDKSCICDIISYVQTKYFRQFPDFLASTACKFAQYLPPWIT